MFGLFRAKGVEVAAPISGEVVALESVDDAVFSQKMVGDGLAIIPVGHSFGAPVSGTISKLFSTKHAYIIRHESDLEVMVHIGLDTVDLKGEGFEALVKEGDMVERGDTIIRADLDRIKSLGKEIVTPVIVSEMGAFKTLKKKSGYVAKDDIIMEVR